MLSVNTMNLVRSVNFSSEITVITILKDGKVKSPMNIHVNYPLFSPIHTSQSPIPYPNFRPRAKIFSEENVKMPVNINLNLSNNSLLRKRRAKI